MDIQFILSAILDLDLPEMVCDDESQVTATQNPLLQRNSEGNLVFLSFEDL